MRTIITLILISLSLSVFSQNELKVNSNFPKKLEQGKIYNVKIVIEKPEIRSYAVYKQKFPSGLEITQVNSHEADFSFNDNILTCRWYRLSKKDKITIDYSIKASNSMTGNYVLNGNMIYVYNNNRAYIDLPIKKFSVVKMSGKTINDKIDNKKKTGM